MVAGYPTADPSPRETELTRNLPLIEANPMGFRNFKANPVGFRNYDQRKTKYPASSLIWTIYKKMDNLDVLFLFSHRWRVLGFI